MKILTGGGGGGGGRVHYVLKSVIRNSYSKIEQKLLVAEDTKYAV